MQVDAQRLQQEYDKLVQGLQVAGVLQQWQRADFDNPTLPQDILNEAVPGNIRRCFPGKPFFPF
jgi:DNA excision repair protein ERCC-2